MQFVTKNAQILYGATDLSGYTNSLTMSFECDLQENTKINSPFKTRLPGLRTVSIDVEGCNDPDIESILNERQGELDVCTIVPDGFNVDKAPAYVMSTLQGTYNQSAAIGEVSKFTLSLQSNEGLARGEKLGYRDVAKTSTVEIALPALRDIEANEELWFVLHVVKAGAGEFTAELYKVAAVEHTFHAGALAAPTTFLFKIKGPQAAVERKLRLAAITDDYAVVAAYGFFTK